MKDERTHHCQNPQGRTACACDTTVKSMFVELLPALSINDFPL